MLIDFNLNHRLKQVEGYENKFQEAMKLLNEFLSNVSRNQTINVKSSGKVIAKISGSSTGKNRHRDYLEFHFLSREDQPEIIFRTEYDYESGQYSVPRYLPAAGSGGEGSVPWKMAYRLVSDAMTCKVWT